MQAVIFYLCAVAIIVGAFGVILSHNPVHSALFLLLTLVSVAVLFLQLDAQLVAAIQVVVYASAIVVLFVFVITLLGVDKHEVFEEPSAFQRPVAITAGALLLVQVVVIAGHHWATGAHSTRGHLGAPRQGNVETLAKSLFTDFVWAFEMTAVLLVIAVVGGVALARRSGQRPGPLPAASAETDGAERRS